MNDAKKIFEFRVVPGPNLSLRQVEALEELQSCILCGTTLDFRHKTNFIDNTVIEESHCLHCNIRSKAADYNLQ
jgi:hypothetical protein